VPVVSLSRSLDSTNSDASATSAFKNVFGSLTLFEDSQHGGEPQDGAPQPGTTLPKSAFKKEPPAEQSSGTEAAPVLQAPNPSALKPALILPQLPIFAQSAQGETPQSTEASEDPTSPPASSQEPTDQKAPATARSQTAALRYSSVSSQARLDVVQLDIARFNVAGLSAASAAPATPVPGAVSAKSGAAPAAVAMKPQVTALPFEIQSSIEPETQLPALSTSQPVDLPNSIPKTLRVTSVSMPPEPLAAQPARGAVAQELPAALPAPLPAKDQAIKVQAGQPETALPTADLVSRVPAVATPTAASLPSQTQPPASVIAPKNAQVVTPAPASVPIASGPAVSNSSPVSSSSPVSTSSDGRSSDAAAPTARSQPAQPAQSQPANTPAPFPEPTPSPVQMAMPAPPPQPETPSAPPGSAASPEPTLATPVADASTSSPAPVLADRAVVDRTPETPSNFLMPQRDASAAISAKVPLVPQAENFAFAVRMLGLESSTNQSYVAQSPIPIPSTTSVAATATTSDTQPNGPVTQPQGTDSRDPAKAQSQTSGNARSEAAAPSLPELLGTQPGAQPATQPGPQQTPGLTPHWNTAAVWQAPEIGSMPGMPEPTEEAHASLPLAPQEARFMPPELPRTSASSEILLHLASNDESTAAIRVADRAGSVSVSVHASDPVLRESLRSNLNELSTQLSDQGWKADVMKSAALAAQSGGQQDSHAGEQRGSQQQPSFGGDRQHQRDRRANGGQWQQELDQQTSGGDAPSGGNG
jgi:hypothetical protein